jgi:hypothetical protein
MSGVWTTTPVRASDAEREAAVARLHHALGEGRLDLTETDRRIAAACAAVFREDLPPLLADIPAAETTATGAELDIDRDLDGVVGPSRRVGDRTGGRPTGPAPTPGRRRDRRAGAGLDGGVRVPGRCRGGLVTATTPRHSRRRPLLVLGATGGAASSFEHGRTGHHVDDLDGPHFER